MLKYLKNKPMKSVIVIAVLAVTTLGILLITKPNGILPPTSQESAPTVTTSQKSTTEQTSEETTAQSSSGDAYASQTAQAVSSASTVKPAETEKLTTQTKKKTTKATTKASTKATAKTTAKPRTTTTAATSSKGSYADFQARVIALVNQERTSRGLKALSGNTKLSNVATMKSQDMADLGYFDHTSPTYGSPFDMMKQFGISYRTAGENIAMGQTTPEQVMNGWMNSEGHRANILNASYTQIGVGIAKNASGRIYWTQMFIG